MSLRLRVALGTAAIAAVAAGLHLLLGYLSFSRLIEKDIARDLAIETQSVAKSVVFKDGRPRLGGDLAWLRSGNTVGFRVERGGRVYLEGGVLPGGDRGDWIVRERPLSGGYRLLVYYYTGEYRKALAGQLRAGLLSLPLILFLAAVMGFAFAGHITGPLRRLTQAAAALSRMEFPEPVPEPEGNDELAALARSFNRMVGEVREALERERAFTRYASHELRTPLATLKAQIEALEAGLLPPEEAIPEARRALARMQGILEGLLTLSRAPRVQLEPLPADVVLHDAWRRLPEPDRRRVALRPPAEEVWLLGDEALVAQVLANLLANALKHTDAEVELYGQRRGGWAVLGVRDRGAGVPPDLLAKLTRPFFRANHRRPGSGLGLALADRAARAMNGRLHLVPAHPGLQAELWLRPAEEVGDG